jgi:dTDP-glucose 4,6-dehydratase
MRILVTGGCGFIGSNFIRHIIMNYPFREIINLDALTYAGNRDNLLDIESEEKYRFIHGRIEDPEIVSKVMENVDIVVNFAAESHVDRSILNAQPFLMTNVVGLQVLLDASRKNGVKRFIHLSTDEVYGSLDTDEGHFTEDTPLSPNSPYSASKVAGDALIRSYINTYDFPAIIVRPSNNYGPYQYPEKLIPLMVTNLIDGKMIPVYGKGMNIRDWLFVEDTCRAIDLVLNKGTIGETYNIGGSNERRNIAVVKKVITLMEKEESSIEYVKDRPGHDYRYSVNSSKLEKELGWFSKVDFDEGVERTVSWYVNNEWWWRPLKDQLNAESKGFWTNPHSRSRYVASSKS